MKKNDEKKEKSGKVEREKEEEIYTQKIIRSHCFDAKFSTADKEYE